MDSSSSSQYRSSAFPSNTSRPRSSDLPIYETNPHFPPMENPIMQENIRLASSSSSPSYSSYAYNYSNHNYGTGGASTAGRDAEMDEKPEEGRDRPSEEEVEREHMFDKVVTPSDVGKLNRLVIPKQHAEKYFPLDSSSIDKGLLLDFEDRNGKSWRFRYSYWNSSQSYVMTKGWSRFVKEKKLDAGDVVSFQRGIGDAAARDRFYIDWRRRPGAPPAPSLPPYYHHHQLQQQRIQFQHGFPLHRSPFLVAGVQQPPPPLPPPPLVLHHQARDHRLPMHPNHQRGSVMSYTGLLGSAATSSGYNEVYNNNNYGVLTPNFCPQGSVAYMRGPPHHQMQMHMELAAATSRRLTHQTSSGCTSRAASDEPMVLDSVAVVPATAGKRLRLFGVNMDCMVDQHSEVPADVNTALVMSPSSSSAEEADGSLQLRLHGTATAEATPSSSSSVQTTTDFLDKGKSSMTLDFDL